MKHFLVLAASVFLLTACGKGLSEQQVQEDGNHVMEYGVAYGMGKSCNLPEAEEYNAAFRRYIRVNYGFEYLTSGARMLKVYEYASQDAAKKSHTPEECTSIKNLLRELTDGIKEI